MHAFADTEIDQGASQVFEHEAVVIQPGTVLSVTFPLLLLIY
jgi:hypothetical protein